MYEKQVCVPWEKEYIRKDGSRVPVLVGVTTLSDHWNEAISFIVDMSEQKLAESNLQIALDAADAANRAKGDFLANMSHEIRTPMNAIIGMTELVLDTTLSRQQREYLSIVLDSSEALLKLINDILDFSKIEAGKLEIEELEFGLRDCVGGAVKVLAVHAHQRGLELVTDIAADIPDRIIGDQSRLRQILVNLIGNAIKFTGEGHVVVHVESEKNTDEELRIHVSVSDTGEGIPADKLQHVFEAFEQLDSSMARKFGGTGLGLAISAKLVDLLGGRIWCESQVGAGTTFHFTARFRPLQADRLIEQTDRSMLHGLRLLIVDDNQAHLNALRDSVHSWQMQPDLAESGETATKLIDRATKTGQPYQLCLIDAHMPGMDGFQLCETISQMTGDETPPMIMMLSPGGQSEDVTRCDEVGADAYLMKPLNQSELFDMIIAVLYDMGADLIVGEIDTDEPIIARQLDILLVEDSPHNQMLATELLKKQHHQVTLANNGKEAVAAAQAREFDVILMDVQMPEMDGLEATRVIRELEHKSGKHVPIIAMTAQAMKGDKTHCLEAGMDAYLPKPVRSRELFETIESVLSKTPHATEKLREDQPQECHPMSNGLLDWNTALENVEQDCDLLRDVSAAFAEECPMMTELIESSFATQNGNEISRAAHTLKGGMRMFGATGPMELAAELEFVAGQGDFEKAAELFANLKPVVSKVIEELSAFVVDPSSRGILND